LDVHFFFLEKKKRTKENSRTNDAPSRDPPRPSIGRHRLADGAAPFVQANAPDTCHDFSKKHYIDLNTSHGVLYSFLIFNSFPSLSSKFVLKSPFLKKSEKYALE